MTSRFESFGQLAQKALALAEEEARDLGHHYVGTEHILLGLVREGDGVAARVLANLGVEVQKLRAAVESIIGRGDRAVEGPLPFTPRAARALDLAADEARRLDQRLVGTEHLLLGIEREGEGIATGVLESLGVNLERVRLELRRLLGFGASHSVRSREGAGTAPDAGELHRSLDAVRRAKDAAISMQEYERAIELRDQEMALLTQLEEAESGRDDEPGAATPRLGRTFRDAFALGMALSPRARRTLESARAQAELLGRPLVEPEHLLLALVAPDAELAAQLERAGVNVATLRTAAQALLREGFGS